MLVPEVDFILNNFILGIDVHPFIFIAAAEAIIYALAGSAPIESMQILMCILGAIFIDLGSAFVMHHCDVSEEQELFARIVCLLVDALLSQILQYDFLAAELVAMVRGTVPATSITISFNKVFSTVHAFPVNEVRCHQYEVSELFVDLMEILEEIEYKIIVA